MHLTFNMNYISNSARSIAMVVANPVQGDSRVIKTAATLSKLGFRVHLFGMSKTAEEITLEGYPFSVELAAHPVPQLKKEGRWLDSSGQRNISLFIERLADNIAARMKDHSFDVLHTHDMYGLPIGEALKETVLGPSTLWIHDLHEYVEGCTNIEEHIRTTMLDMEKAYIRKPDALTTVSPILSKLIAEQYDVVEPGLVLNAPRISDYDPWYPRPLRKSLDLNQDIPLLVYNGNVKPIRGVHFVVEALPLLPRVHLALITNSRGQYVDDLLQKARKLGVSARLRLHPYVPNHEVTSFVGGANAGVNPVSLYPNSDLALPNKIFEYIHSGTPIVSTATKALTKFLQTNQCGLTFPEGDVNALASAVKETLVRYPEGLPSVAQGSSLALEYSWESQEEVLANIYTQMLGKIRPTQCTKSQRKIDPIIHLPTFAANQPCTLANALNKNGFVAESASLGKNSYKYECSLEINNQTHHLSSVKSYLKDQSLDNFQTYHFHVRPLLYDKFFGFPTGIDLVLLKAMNKSVFFHFRGSEIRFGSVFKAACPYHYEDEQRDWTDIKKPYVFDERQQRAFRDFVCGVCDDVFVNDPELQTYVPNSLIVPRAIDCICFKPPESKGNRSVPLVVHAPSRRGVKGTDFVLRACEQLKKQGYVFEFKLVENVSHREAMDIYREATIIVDQLRIGWYGVLAVEGMALGKAVVSYVRHDLRHYLPCPSPLAYANPENITDVLGYLLSNPDVVKSYGENGQHFARVYHNADSIVKNLTAIYNRPLRPIDPVAAADFLHYQTNKKTKDVKKNEIKTKKGKNNISIIQHYNYLKPVYLREFYRVVKDEGILQAVKKSIDFLKR